ncbi:sigma factor G inhibitor Gin [Sediminibacillus massiliensis]|uniref:sigma factor G inhibitor Gin n=1 Tax=Sediminibacillus massiliensis TaxID=1926277 RepID=UPI0009886B0A|nr:sigma factor G inhibitor Gin [Sediminibacillus massiliensis]
MRQNEKCGICEQNKPQGIHLYTLFICCDCEQKIVHTDPEEAQYKHYLKKLKRMHQSTLYS